MSILSAGIFFFLLPLLIFAAASTNPQVWDYIAPATSGVYIVTFTVTGSDAAHYGQAQ